MTQKVENPKLVMTDEQYAAFMAQDQAHKQRMQDIAMEHKAATESVLENYGNQISQRLEDKRDYFAGQAVANLAIQPPLNGYQHEIAKASYAIADAMMEERDKTPPNSTPIGG